jgi:diguanylate cyclase (GGDEF)-like protein
MRKLAVSAPPVSTELADTMPTDLGASLAGIWKTTTQDVPKSQAEWVEETLEKKFKWLIFPSQLENQYIEHLPRSKLSGSVQASLFVTVVANFFLMTDYIMVPDVFDMALVLRLAILTPFGLLLALLSGLSVSMRVRETLLLSMDVLSAAIHAMICIQSNSPEAQAYLLGTAVIMLYATSHLRTRFWVSAVSSISVVGIYVLATTQLSHRVWPLLISEGILLLATLVFTLYHLYTLEHESRANFLLSLRHQHMQSDLKKANRSLDRVSRVDVLTQVSNRRHFDQFIQQVWQRAKGDAALVTVLMMDVDSFKGYNDHLGHLKGDECLIAIAKAIYKSLRKPGDLVARYGGEEFIAVLSKADIEQGMAAGERIRQAVQDLRIPHPASTVQPWVTVSIGVATLRANYPDISPKTLIAMADKALYQAKNSGRNRVVSNESFAKHE